MATTIYVRREGSRLEPTAEWCEDAIRALPVDTEFRCTIVRERSLRQSKAYWGLCHKVAKMLQAMGKENADKEYVSDCYKLATDHCEIRPLPLRLRTLTGQTTTVVMRSISFDAMDQDQFNGFMNRVLAYTVTELLPHVPLKELRADVDDLIRKINREGDR